MAKVKICGITNWTDARRACEAGADFLGFNFYKKSPRYISPGRAGKIVGRLPLGVAAVGVFVNESPARIVEIAQTVGLDYVQLHGDESPEVMTRVARELRESLGGTSAAKAALNGRQTAARLKSCPDEIQIVTQALKDGRAKETAMTQNRGAERGRTVKVIKALRVGKGFRAAEMERFKGVSAFLLDAFDAKARGGTGKTFDWGVARRAAARKGWRIFLAGGLTPENAAEASRMVKPFALDVCSGVESAPGKKDAARMVAFIQAVRKDPGFKI